MAMRRPERFLAVHAHVASSFDEPVPTGRSVLWCVTTGEFSAESGVRMPGVEILPGVCDFMTEAALTAK